jgi:hypothetical protein
MARHGGNQGGHPRRIDRTSLARTTIRVQPSVLLLLNQLKKKHMFKDHNSTIKYYLPPSIHEDKVIFHTATELRLLNTPPTPEVLVGSISNELYKRTNNNHHKVKSYRSITRKGNRHIKKARQQRKEF